LPEPAPGLVYCAFFDRSSAVPDNDIPIRPYDKPDGVNGSGLVFDEVPIVLNQA
jgi:hypothetical protein